MLFFNDSGPWELVQVVDAFTDANDPDNNLGASTWIEIDGENFVHCTFWGGYHVRDCEGKIVNDHHS